MKFKLKMTLFFMVAVSVTAANLRASPLQEQLSFAIELKGDLKGLYEFSGSWNEKIEAVNETSVKAETDERTCATLDMLARKVSLKNRAHVELWLVLNCTIQGQKKQFKLHRIFFNADETPQSKKIRSLAPNIQNLLIEFRDFTIVKGK